MGFAISLRSDHPSADAVRALWLVAEGFESRASMAALDYPPHITLAIYDGDKVDEMECRRAIRRAGQDRHAMAITFGAIRTFDGPPMILWAAPGPNGALEAVHSALHEAIDPDECRPHYRPGAWTPHCTLGTQVRADRTEAAVAFARGWRGRIDVVFDTLDCISFPPLAAVERLDLLPHR